MVKAADRAATVLSAGCESPPTCRHGIRDPFVPLELVSGYLTSMSAERPLEE